MGSCWRGWQHETPSAAGDVAAWPLCCTTFGRWRGSRCCGFAVLILFLAAERQMFLATWKDIPNENEAQFQIKDCSLNAGGSKPFRRTQLSSWLATGDQLIPVIPAQAAGR